MIKVINLTNKLIYSQPPQHIQTHLMAVILQSHFYKLP